MPQGNRDLRDLPDDTRRWKSNLPSGIYQQQLGLLRQNSEVQECQRSFGRGQRVNNHHQKEGNTNCLRLKI